MPIIISELNLVQLLPQQILRLVPENKGDRIFFRFDLKVFHRKAVITDRLQSTVICMSMWLLKSGHE